jgi:oligopeptide transport system ATP-binding protein
MYSGYIVEEADVFRLYENPLHPYTISLLRSLPRVDSGRRSERLVTIPGFPSDGLTLFPGCPFAPRCSFAVERCGKENPKMETIETDHEVACWVDVSTGRER